ncbi:MAG: hypothetical protein IPN33_25405 [Saprospiraceae bacterium]|nr:hypothetical protein [Saprospiraceae bacterium]
MKVVRMLKSCAVTAFGKSHSAPKGATFTFPDDIAASLVNTGLAEYVTGGWSVKEDATLKAEKQTRKSGKTA